MSRDSIPPGGDEPPQLSPVKEGEILAGKYSIGRVLGVGGMGVVMAAYDQLLERKVAIKFLLPRLAWSESSVQRFMHEARAATRVTGEHAVKLLEIDKLPSGVPFFVMEYLAGQDLKALLLSEGPLARERAVDYVLQALQAVAEGHARRLVHRDLKPSNLFLTTHADGTPLIKVLDFGIAKTLHLEHAEQSAGITETGDVLLGSPAYMSPEQLVSPRDVDERSDIWSMGVTLYELLSGRLPFDGDSKFALMTRIMQANGSQLEAPPSSETLPDALVKVVWRCLQKQREARFATVCDFARALAPFGSEDANMSLRRIVRLSRLTPTSQHPSNTPPGGLESIRATSTTLPGLPSHIPPPPIAHAQREGKRALAWIAAGALVLMIAATALLLAQSGTKPAASTAAPQTTSVPVERPFTVPAPPPPAESVARSPVLVAPSVAASPSVGAATSRVVGSSQNTKAKRPVVVAATATLPSASAVPPPSASTLPDIEALIQDRY
jgi:eukaryotic-like serine/threonine-protein kinase